MSKIKSHYTLIKRIFPAKNSVISKLSLSFLILTFILSFLIIIIFYQFYYSQVKERICESFSINLDYVCAGVYSEFVQLYHMTDYIFASQDVKKAILLESDDGMETREINKHIQKTLGEYFGSHLPENINHIIIEGSNGYSHTYTINYTDAIGSSGLEQNYDDFVEKAKNSPGQFVWCGLIERIMYPTNPNSLKVREVAIIRTIKDMKFKEDMGIMYIAVNPDLFLKWIQQTDLFITNKYSILLVDNYGNILNKEDKPTFTSSEIQKIISSPAANSNEGWVLPQKDIIVFSRDIADGWHIIGLIPSEMIKLDRMSMLYVLVIFMCVIVCMIIGFIMSKNIFEPMKVISDTMRKISKGDKSLRISIKSKDEISELGCTINKMLDHIDRLNQDNLQKELIMRDAMHYAKQAQINPHFVNNTLSGIRLMAIMVKAEQIKNAIDSLWQIIKYNSDLERKYYVTIRDEVEIVKQYIYLMQLCYTNKFDVKWDIEENTLSCECIKSFLQPFVENSIIHGAYPSKQMVIIRISCYKDNSSLVINIYDNGVGMDSEVLKKINNNDYYPTKHIGISNVNERLKYAYGEDFSIQINSEPGRYTNVMITTPYRIKAEKNM